MNKANFEIAKGMLLDFLERNTTSRVLKGRGMKWGVRYWSDKMLWKHGPRIAEMSFTDAGGGTSMKRSDRGGTDFIVAAEEYLVWTLEMMDMDQSGKVPSPDHLKEIQEGLVLSTGRMLSLMAEMRMRG